MEARELLKRPTEEANHAPVKRAKLTDDDTTVLQSQSLLDELPQEIVWAIIEFTPESVHALRLTSKRLQNYVDEYAMHPANNKRDCVTSITIQRQGILATTIDLKIPTRYANLFELRFWLGQPTIELISMLGRVRNAEDRTYKLSITRAADQNLLVYLRGCLGKRVSKVGLLEPTTSVLDQLSVLITDCRISEIRFYLPCLTYAFSHRFLNVIQNSKVHLVKIGVVKAVLLTQVDFFLKISSYIHAISIIQIKNLRKIQDKFYGIPNSAWPSLIVDMLSRTLNNIDIMHSEHMSDDCIHAIREQIPRIKKKICLQIRSARSTFRSPNINNFLNYQCNNHSVVVDNQGSLTVKPL